MGPVDQELVSGGSLEARKKVGCNIFTFHMNHMILKIVENFRKYFPQIITV